MQFSILVTASPHDAGAVTALHTAEAVCRSAHQLYCVFFYGDGVQLANRMAARAGHDNRAPRQWQELVATADVPARVCVGAALRRGVADRSEARRAGLDGDNLAAGFQLVGLGDWVDALTHSDRVLHFG